NFDVFIPNAFSPNFDGVNDYLEVYAGTSVKQIKSFKVFNRWGALVFYSEAFEPLSGIGRWDGIFNGLACNSELFTYVTEVIFINGDTRIFEGGVLLVR
ncbi:MAG: gliding motility-associated C-terminal domain-containing protein, partial [Saprospiraceae bacterium]